MSKLETKLQKKLSHKTIQQSLNNKVGELKTSVRAAPLVHSMWPSAALSICFHPFPSSLQKAGERKRSQRDRHVNCLSSSDLSVAGAMKEFAKASSSSSVHGSSTLSNCSKAEVRKEVMIATENEGVLQQRLDSMGTYMGGPRGLPFVNAHQTLATSSSSRVQHCHQC